MQAKKAWELRLENELCKRWKERREEYEKGEKKDELDDKEQEATSHLMLQQSEEWGQNEKRCRQEIASVQAHVYEEVSKASLDTSNDDALLLPSVVDTDTCITDEICQLDLTGIQRVAIASAILQERENKESFARRECYRNLAEKLKTEKRELASKMNDKVVLVRDFWRNTIREGCTRAGKMVQRALTSEVATNIN